MEKDPATDRFLSSDGCRAMGDRIIAMTSGGGTSYVGLTSSWRGNLRWARNRVSTGGETQLTQTVIGRTIHGATGMAVTNSLDDGALQRTVRHAEALLRLQDESPEHYPDIPPVTHPHVRPTLWFDATYAVDAEARGDVAEAQIRPAEAAGLLAAGYVETAAIGA
jgi:predicted Zn-dependent protease